MNKIMFIFLVVSILVIAGCGGKKVNIDEIDDSKLYSCEKDSDCRHVKGCHEDASACVNRKYAGMFESENCNEDNCLPCSTCKCENKRCKNELTLNEFCC